MDRYSYPRLVIGAAVTVAACQMIGCTPDEEHRNIPPVEVKTVTAYGLTLDEKASPQQVAYVMLRSIADDVNAAQAHPPKRDEQKAAMRQEHALLAYTTVEPRLLQEENMVRAEKKASLGSDRDEKLWDFSRQLAPIVAHYVSSFDPTFEAAVTKMRLVGGSSPDLAHVRYEAAHDPGASDPENRDSVIIDIELARETAEGKKYWRVAKLGFAGRPTTNPVVQPIRVNVPQLRPPTRAATTTAPGN